MGQNSDIKIMSQSNVRTGQNLKVRKRFAVSAGQYRWDICPTRQVVDERRMSREKDQTDKTDLVWSNESFNCEQTEGTKEYDLKILSESFTAVHVQAIKKHPKITRTCDPIEETCTCSRASGTYTTCNAFLRCDVAFPQMQVIIVDIFCPIVSVFWYAYLKPWFQVSVVVYDSSSFNIPFRHIWIIAESQDMPGFIECVSVIPKGY